MSKKSNLKRKKNKAEFNNEKSKLPNKAKSGEMNASKYFYDMDDPNNILSDERPTHLILNFAEPLFSDEDDEDDIHFALSFAIIAWDIAMLPLDLRKEEINSVVYDLELNILEKNELLSMIKRKDEYFSEFEFFIENYIIDFDEFGTLNFKIVIAVFEDGND